MWISTCDTLWIYAAQAAESAEAVGDNSLVSAGNPPCKPSSGPPVIWVPDAVGSSTGCFHQIPTKNRSAPVAYSNSSLFLHNMLSKINRFVSIHNADKGKCRGVLLWFRTAANLTQSTPCKIFVFWPNPVFHRLFYFLPILYLQYFKSCLVVGISSPLAPTLVQQERRI